ncbi:MAG: ABC transporter permease, partial [Mycoplasmataceae bacterium]|nr:ABC transporter permease [Mycoplasmataceae bacterium]
MVKMFGFIFKYSFKGRLAKFIPIVLVLINLIVVFLAATYANGEYSDGLINKFIYRNEAFKTFFQIISIASSIILCIYLIFLTTKMFGGFDQSGLSLLLCSKPINSWKIILAKYLSLFIVMVTTSLLLAASTYSFGYALLQDSGFPILKAFISQIIGNITVSSLIISIGVLLASKLKTIQIILLVIGSLFTFVIFGTLIKTLSGYNSETDKYSQSIYLDKDGKEKSGLFVTDHHMAKHHYLYDKSQFIDINSQFQMLHTMVMPELYSDVLPKFSKVSNSEIKGIKMKSRFFVKDNNRVSFTQKESDYIWTFTPKEFKYNLNFIKDFSKKINDIYPIKKMFNLRSSLQNLIDSDIKYLSDFFKISTTQNINPSLMTNTEWVDHFSNMDDDKKVKIFGQHYPQSINELNEQFNIDTNMSNSFLVKKGKGNP